MLLVCVIALFQWTYHFDLALAAILDAEWERFLESGRGIVKCKEGLVRLLAGLAFGGCEDDLEGVGGREADRGRKGRSERESMRLSVLSCIH